jgi:hypothetical protein
VVSVIGLTVFRVDISKEEELMKHLFISSIATIALLAGMPMNGTAEHSRDAQDRMWQSLGNRKHIRLEQMPDPARRAFRNQSGDAPIKMLDQCTLNGSVYQVTFERHNQPMELEVSADGFVLSNNARRGFRDHLSSAREVSYDRLPQAVQDVISREVGRGEITSLRRGNWQGTIYAAKVDRRGFENVFVTEDGMILSGLPLNEAAGAAAEWRGRTEVSFKDLPWPVQKAMLDRSGYAHFEFVEKFTADGGRVSYRAIYPRNNDRFELRVSDQGAILGEQRMNEGYYENRQNVQPLRGAVKMSFNQLPEAVRNSAWRQIGALRIEDIDRGMLNGQVVYEIAFKRDKNGRTSELRIREDGKVLGEHFD